MISAKFKAVCQEALKKIKPTIKETKLLQELTNSVIDSITFCSKQISIKVKDAIPGGSFAKGTNLKGDSDIDLFVRVITEQRDDLKNFVFSVKSCLESALKSEAIIAYAENPYLAFDLKKNDMLAHVDIVPVAFAKDVYELPKALKISGMARSPFHTLYAREKLNDAMRDEVRLLKYFLKKKRAYGVFGFTGWLSELLIIHYGTFENVLRNADEIVHLRLDIEGRFSPKELEKMFPSDRIVILDPIDPRRNAAAGIQGFIGELKLIRFRNSAKEAINNPQKTFVEWPIRGNVTVEFIPKNLKTIPPENYLTSLGHIALALKNSLEQYGYILKDAYICEEPYLLYLLVEPNKLEKYVLKGPPVNMKNAVSCFLKAHKDDYVYIEHGRYYAKKAPKYRTNKEAVTGILKRMSFKLFKTFKIL
ncbi:MAG: nucleotidyltransferase domain-containing protein [Candidatus Asgardarchaeia archaeon]